MSGGLGVVAHALGSLVRPVTDAVFDSGLYDTIEPFLDYVPAYAAPIRRVANWYRTGLEIARGRVGPAARHLYRETLNQGGARYPNWLWRWTRSLKRSKLRIRYPQSVRNLVPQYKSPYATSRSQRRSYRGFPSFSGWTKNSYAFQKKKTYQRWSPKKGYKRWRKTRSNRF